MNQQRKTAAKRVVATTALGIGLVAGGAGLASAATHDSTETATATPAPPGAPTTMAGGVVTAISDSSITVEDLSGTSTTYAITSSTTFSEGAATIELSQVTVGEHVSIQVSSSDATTATGVNVMPAMLVGQVTSVVGDTVAITDPEGFTRTIVVGSSTTYSESGATAALGDVTVGTLISARGQVDANHTALDASSVMIGLVGHLDGAGPGPGIAPPPQ